MEFSEYENIEIFNKTQSFGINKCENQTIRYHEPPDNINSLKLKSVFLKLLITIIDD
jgi:hypothetical protein